MPGRSGNAVTVIRAYTDGACLGNPGPGGWAWAVPDGPFASGPEPATTNQRMEIRAALEAVRANEGPLTIVSDSTYVCNCFRDRWWEKWVANGWKNAAKKDVANRDLWEQLVDAVQAAPGRVRFEWVKGHAGDVMNDLVDRLAVDAARSQAGRTGVGQPEGLGPADSPGFAGGSRSASGSGSASGSASASAAAARGGSGPPPPEGHRLVVAGLRPPGLGGYGDNPVAGGVRSRLAVILEAKLRLEPDLVVLTGLGLGAEQLGAEAAADAGAPYVAVLPFPEPDAQWPNESRERFAKLLAGAAGAIVLQSVVPENRQRAGAALARRDAWLARHGHEAVVVWDLEDHLIGRLVRSLQDHMGETEVWVVEPGPSE
ncbi:MAG: ribonuclease [Acidimicrobiaceae bacterium]|nr:ribonuclease [Acidimicrobiaceae bacterium]